MDGRLWIIPENKIAHRVTLAFLLLLSFKQTNKQTTQSCNSQNINGEKWNTVNFQNSKEGEK